MDRLGNMPDEPGYDPNAKPLLVPLDSHGHGDVHVQEAIEDEKKLALEEMEHEENGDDEIPAKSASVFSPKLLHEVFLNPGLFLLFGGIVIGFISGLQGPEVTRADDNFFVTLFQGVLCLFLLEMGMTASRKLRDLRTAGLPFILFGLLAPNLFATTGILVAHLYSSVTHTHFAPGTYVLFG